MKLTEFEKVIEVIAALRNPKTGCPWDLKQDHKSLLKYLIEETYEYIDAVEEGNYSKMEEELGDVLLQILLHCQIAKESEQFDIESISKVLADKMIRRHPHVFDEDFKKNIDANEVVENWEKIKKEEKKSEKTLINSSIANFPALMAADKIGKKTQKVNFDWENYGQVLYKVEEEWQELKEELVPEKNISIDRVEEEIGDFLFSTAQLARHLNLDPEATLRKANLKFLKRFQAMEELISTEGLDINNMNQSEMDIYWNKAKQNEKL